MVDGEISLFKLFIEVDFIVFMEKYGIGMDVIYVEYIEIIKVWMYVGFILDKWFFFGYLGMGFVEGYDFMGYEMFKFDFWVELEVDLKLICDGKKDKFVVLR